MATDVRRASDEHSRPIVEVARQVVAMIRKKTMRVQNRSPQFGQQGVGQQDLLGQQERQDRRDPKRRQQLGHDDLAGTEQRRQQQAQASAAPAPA